MVKISAIVFVFNQDSIIKRCLESIKDVVDEIVVMHDGPCRDKTVEYAREYTENVIIGEDKGISEYNYIDAVKATTGDWILKLDGDEFISPRLQNNLRNLTKTKDYDAYQFAWPLWTGSKYMTHNYPYKPAFFRKSKVKFFEGVHRNLEVNGKMKTSNLLLEHRPPYNNWSFKDSAKKYARVIKFHARSYFEFSKDVRSYNYSKDELHNMDKRKRAVQKFPITLYAGNLYNDLMNIVRYPYIIFQRGFWISFFHLQIYTYLLIKQIYMIKKEQLKSKA